MDEYIIIPDIHADIDRLARSLQASGKTPVAFLGDLIDAGRLTKQVDEEAVLSRVRGLVDSGHAVAVTGNHGLNAILYHRKYVDGTWLRSHTAAKTKQHRSFIEAFGVGSKDAKEWADCFLTLPLWYELDGLRLNHACWDEAAIPMVGCNSMTSPKWLLPRHPLARLSNGCCRVQNLRGPTATCSTMQTTMKTLASPFPSPTNYRWARSRLIPRPHSTTPMRLRYLWGTTR